MKDKQRDYPPHREDWLMVADYADKKSKFSCILCDKTHKIKDCPNKVFKIDVKPTKSKYEYTEEENPSNYGW